MRVLVAGSSSIHLGMLRDVSANSFLANLTKNNPVLMVSSMNMIDIHKTYMTWETVEG